MGMLPKPLAGHKVGRSWWTGCLQDAKAAQLCFGGEEALGRRNEAIVHFAELLDDRPNQTACFHRAKLTWSGSWACGRSQLVLSSPL